MTESLLPVTAPAEVTPLPAATPSLRSRIELARVVAEGGQALLIWFSLFVVYGGQRPLSQAGLVAVTVAAAIWLVALRFPGVPGCNVLGRAVAVGVGTAGGLVVVAVLNSSIPAHDVSLPLLLAGGFAVFSSATAWGWIVDRTLATRRRVLLVGTEGAQALLAEELRTHRRPAYDVVGAIPGAEALAEVVEAQHPDIVVLTDEATYGPALERLLDARANVRVAGFESFFEFAFGRVPVDQITPAWFMSLLHPRQRVYTRRAKRTFDIAVALALLVVTAPVFALVALGTKLGGGPVLYRQTRLGEGGRRFTIYKFRTMRCDAEREGAAFACADDPRVTRVGRVLRRTHLDELPQLWNVLRGDMSVVGPRPERPEFIELIEASVPFWNRRLLVKPGITGWAQVRCGYATDLEDMETKLSYDLWYLRHGSMLVDLAVCAMTVLTVVRRPRSL
jgi:exopolysaccharide biosynthesis polyprenyl glycosylphosphotransferase